VTRSDNSIESGAKPAGAVGKSNGQRMVLDSADGGELWVGGGPPGQLYNVTSDAFVGCMHELFVNGEKIGLWNFRRQMLPCSGCTEG
jgi:hypothetical protein